MAPVHPPSTRTSASPATASSSSAPSAGKKAKRVIDATGLVITPGFIDPHTHTADDLTDPKRSQNAPYLMQGVTTVATGNDGDSPEHIGETLAKWTRQGIGTNAVLFIGQGTVRREVMGMSDAKPTPEQIEKMKALVDTAMNEGAIGLSTGLYYAPGSYSTTEEVIALARVAAQHGGIYDTHMRDESTYNIGLMNSVRETLRIGKEANIPVMISHIKALGADVWGQSSEVIALIERRAQGRHQGHGQPVSVRRLGHQRDGIARSPLGGGRWKPAEEYRRPRAA